MPAVRPGDWMCPACGNHNFASRQACNKCGEQRVDGGGGGCMPSGYGPAASFPSSSPGASSPYGRPTFGSGAFGGGDRPAMMGGGGGGGGGPVREMKDGDWMCPACGNHNFASRVKCNKCNHLREGMKDGDWICRSCKHHNFAKNVQCNKCGAPRAPDQGKGGCGKGGCGKGGGGMMMMQHPMQQQMQMEQQMQMMMEQAYMAGKGGMAFPWGGPGMHGGGGGGGMHGGMHHGGMHHGGGMMMETPGGKGGKGMKEGDWMCPSCGNHNFASRTNCNKCQALRPGYKHGDWTCTSCRAHNFASRVECLKCSAPKPAHLA